MDIPFWFWTSIITSIIVLIVAVVNLVTSLDGIGRLQLWRVWVHIACCIAWLLSVWSTIGFGIAWIVTVLKS
jgi:hypothetical protein